MNRIEFFVPGTPAPGGSKKAFVLRRRDGSFVTRPNGAPVVNITDDAGEANKNWRANVAFFARQAFTGEPLNGALRLCVIFYMPRIGSHFGSGRNAGVLKPNAPTFHTVKPDTTKLLRSTEDALTGILWADDARIAVQHAEKQYAAKTGALILVETLVGAPPAAETEGAKQTLFGALA